METTQPTRRLFTVEQAMERLGSIGKTTIYALVKSGALRTVKIGRRTFVADDELERYIDSLSRDAGPDHADA